jgi:hypothetical protein
LRYQVIPPFRSWMSTLKASSSFQARGRVTGFQAASSNSGLSAPAMSPVAMRQPSLKGRSMREAAAAGLASASRRHRAAHSLPRIDPERMRRIDLPPQLARPLQAFRHLWLDIRAPVKIFSLYRMMFHIMEYQA